MQANLTHPVTFDHLNLQVLADGEHSVPTALRITTNDGGNVLVHLPAVKDVDKKGAVADMPVSFKAVTGSVIRFTVEAVRQEATINWYSEQPIVLPFAIASIGLPGVHFTPENPAAQIPGVCRDNLMTVDGQPVWLKVTGTVGTAENLGGLRVSGCGPDAKGIHLGAGTHTVVTQWGKLTGLDLDRLVFDSAPGGAAEPLLASGDLRPVPGTLAGGGVAALPAPTVRVVSSSATNARLSVTGASGPFWLVLGQSVNAGWTAHVAGGPSLGGSTLIDGFANGWYVEPHGQSFTVDLTWTPQHEVDIALVVSAISILACLLLAFVPWRRLPRRRRQSGPRRHLGRRRGASVGEAGTAEATETFDGRWPATLGPPWLADGRPAGLLESLAVAAVAGGICLLVLPPSSDAAGRGSRCRCDPRLRQVRGHSDRAEPRCAGGCHRRRSRHRGGTDDQSLPARRPLAGEFLGHQRRRFHRLRGPCGRLSRRDRPATGGCPWRGRGSVGGCPSPGGPVGRR